jgi:hypothetical protein
VSGASSSVSGISGSSSAAVTDFISANAEAAARPRTSLLTEEQVCVCVTTILQLATLA